MVVLGLIIKKFMEKITISKETLQELLSNFHEACSLCSELNIYEHPEMNECMKEMKEWVKETFGKRIDKNEYE